MNSGNQINLFDNESDTAMYKHKLTLEKIRDELINFGLTKSQAKVFIYLGKYGSKTASEIAKALQLPRTETYHLVNSLQNMGLAVAEMSHPTKYLSLCRIAFSASQKGCSAGTLSWSLFMTSLRPFVVSRP